MGDPVKLSCSICGEEYYLHPADERPIKNADKCPTCATFQDGMKGLFAEKEPQPEKVTMGMLILGLSTICIVLVLAWFVFHF